MLLLVGLGNPGAKYAKNRHNIGFLALDRIADDYGFSPWRARFQGQVAEGRLGSERVTLLKPETFMNLSGQSVGEAMRYLKLTPAEVVVLHDELDLAPGRVRAKSGSGHAGHNGLRSIHQHIGEAYGRVRIGIGHPGHKDRVAGYVLSDFAKAEEGMLDDLLRGISDGAAALASGDAGRFQNAVAARVAPARNSGTGRGEGAGDAAKAGAERGGAGARTAAGFAEKADAKTAADPAAKADAGTAGDPAVKAADKTVATPATKAANKTTAQSAADKTTAKTAAPPAQPAAPQSFAEKLRALGDKFRQT